MAATVTYTFVPGTDIEAAEVNQNFADLTDFLNGLDIATVPVPIVQGGTGGTTAAAGLANLGGASLTYVNQQLSTSGPVLRKDQNLADVNDATAAINNLGAAALSLFTDGRVVNFQGTQPFGANILKWGSGTVPNSAATVSSVSVVFPDPFPANCFSVVVTPGGLANSGGGQPGGGYNSKTKTGFTAVLDAGAVTFNQTCPFSYFAIGN